MRQLSTAGESSRVTFIYLANVGASVTGHENAEYFAKLYHTLGQLPFDPQALTLVSQGTRVAYVRGYQRAHYDFLSSVGTDALIGLVEKPLACRTLGNTEDAIRSLKEGVIGITRNRRARGLASPDSSNYLALLDRVVNMSKEANGFTLAEFETWAKREWPASKLRTIFSEQ